MGARRRCALVLLSLAAVLFVFGPPAAGGVVTYGCKPRNRDLRPDARLNIGILHRPDGCLKNDTRRTRRGDKVKVHYEGRLFRDCRKFDSSRDRGEEYEFTLGENNVIKGWERGLLNMCKGERRKLIIPSDQGYGPRGSGSDGHIPGGATLLFDVELTQLPK